MSGISKIAIFGATGTTGRCCVQTALNDGLTVTALVHLDDDLPSDVIKIRGDVTCYEDVEKVIEGQHGVVVALGTRNCLEPTTMMSTGINNIIKAMDKFNIKPISACLSAFLFREDKDVPSQFCYLNAEHAKMLASLKSSDLTWIAVLPPHIAAEKPEHPYVVKHDEGAGRRVSKYDLGEFLVRSLSMQQHHHKVCGITTPT